MWGTVRQEWFFLCASFLPLVSYEISERSDNCAVIIIMRNFIMQRGKYAMDTHEKDKRHKVATSVSLH